MPARYLKCAACGSRVATFLDDKELEEAQPVCPDCGCPIMKLECPE